ncbi:hypothetical protein N0V82_009328 [Gnomoniopsis sp. IMI 355080]|nr:hypothetical protein N0V82_009328 [Gnomoniopsis sp. IMI 355080]
MMYSLTTAVVLALASGALASPIAARAGDLASSTQNDLQGNNCAQNIVIFARGTTEPGNVGLLAGPPFFQALAQQVGANNVAVQGVDYAADIPGFLAGGDADGSKTMAQLTQQAIEQCPQSKVIMSGYSQGSQLAHNAAEMLPADVISKVAGAVLFGDPDNGQAVQGVDAAKTKVICHDGDAICAGQALVLPPHLTYGDDADAAAQFAASL